MEPLASTDNMIAKAEEECLDLQGEVLGRPNKASEVQTAANEFKKEDLGLETNNSPRRRSMADLPVEVWCRIFSFLPGKNHIRAAVHSSPMLLSLWNANRVQLISNMLRMAPGVLEEAACAANFPTFPRSNYIEGEIERRPGANAIHRHTPFPMDICIPIKLALSFTGNKNRCLASGCGFRDVSRLEKLHPTVRKLADVYIKQCALSNPALSGTLRERPITLSERIRIEKAFYRFEIFRRAFGPFEGQWAEDESYGFFSHDYFSRDNAKRDPDWLDDPVPGFIQEFKDSFNTVELIQLHCIYRFLKRLITPAINDMLWHDCELLETNLIGDWATDDRVSVHVFAGLQHVYNIWSAFKDRRVTRMCLTVQMVNSPPRLPNHMSRQHDTIFYHVLSAELYTGRGSSLEVTKSKIAVHDVDEGPRDACLALASSIQAMGRQSPGELRHELDGLAPHRQWGFVMWDRRRLDALGFFKQHYASPELVSPFLSDDLIATWAMFEQHQSSLRQSVLRHLQSGGSWYPGISNWWDGRRGPAYALRPRQYNTWYPLAAPEDQGDVQAA